MSWFDPLWIAPILILFFASFIRSALGFGDALLAMPLLTFFIDVQDAAVIVALVQLVISLLVLSKCWHEIDFRSGLRLVFAAAVGIPFGIYALQSFPEVIVLTILGLLLIFFGAYFITEPKLPYLKNEQWGLFFGFIAGCFGGAYNTVGPPVVLYGVLRRWSSLEFRATLHGFFLPVSALVVLGHWSSGLWTRGALMLFGASLLPVAVAVLLGELLARRAQSQILQKMVYLLIVLFGVLLVGKSIFGV